MQIIGKPEIVAKGKRIKEGKSKGVALELRTLEHKSGENPSSITPYAHRPNCDGIVAAVVEKETNRGNKLLFLGNSRPALTETNPTGKVIELVAGKVGDEGQEDFDTAAKREVMEEAGYTADQISAVHAYDSFGTNHASSSGLTSEGTNFYNVKVKGKRGENFTDGGTIDNHFEVGDNLQEIVSFLSSKAKEGYNISKQALTGLFMWVADNAAKGTLKLNPEA